MPTYGTCYFIDLPSAINYYLPYHQVHNIQEIMDHKINEGEIYIGTKPPLKLGDMLSLNHEGRYVITTK
jgi:hypothetical protein